MAEDYWGSGSIEDSSEEAVEFVVLEVLEVFKISRRGSTMILVEYSLVSPFESLSTILSVEFLIASMLNMISSSLTVVNS